MSARTHTTSALAPAVSRPSASNPDRQALRVSRPENKQPQARANTANVLQDITHTTASAAAGALGRYYPLARRWLTSAEAAAYLGFASGDVLAVMRAQGRAPPHVGTGKMIRYDINVLDAWVASRPTNRTHGSGVGEVAR
jgi:hypothetical protein